MSSLEITESNQAFIVEKINHAMKPKYTTYQRIFKD